MIDVVIVTYGSRLLIERCLRAASAIPDLGRIVVVDHGSDGTADVAARAGVDVVRDPTNPGFGAGQNRGLAMTTAPYVLLLNPDAEVEPMAVAAGASLLEARPDVALVQGAIAGSGGFEPERSQGRELGPLHLWGRALALRHLLGSARVRRMVRRVPTLADHVDRVPGATTDVETLAATAVLARREALVEVGGFAAGYFLYGEDLDLCRRLRDAGWRLVAVPDQWATHISGASSATTVARELEWWRGTMTFAARWWEPAGWRKALAAAGVRWARLALAHPAQAGPAWRALVVEPRRARIARE